MRGITTSSVERWNSNGHKVKAVRADALEALPALALRLPADSVIYCDPPYPLETRSNRHYYGAYELTAQEQREKS